MCKWLPGGGKQTLQRAGTAGAEQCRRRVVSGEERGRGQTALSQGGVFILKEAELLDGHFWRWDGEGLVG